MTDGLDPSLTCQKWKSAHRGVRLPGPYTALPPTIFFPFSPAHPITQYSRELIPAAAADLGVARNARWLAASVLGVTGLENAAPVLPLDRPGPRPGQPFAGRVTAASPVFPCSHYYGQHVITGLPLGDGGSGLRAGCVGHAVHDGPVPGMAATWGWWCVVCVRKVLGFGRFRR
jgi:hypothetical protein